MKYHVISLDMQPIHDSASIDKARHVFYWYPFTTGWWFGCHQLHFPINIGLLIIPIDELVFFQRGGPTTNQIFFIWRFPEIGVPPVIIHFNGVFHHKQTSYWILPAFICLSATCDRPSKVDYLHHLRIWSGELGIAGDLGCFFFVIDGPYIYIYTYL